MAPTRFRIARLARECDCDPEEAVLRLMDAGFQVEQTSDLLPRRDATRAREILRSHGKPAEIATPTKPPFEWPSLKPGEVQYLTTETVLGIHEALTAEFAETIDAVEPPGIRDYGLLESAVLRPQVAAIKYPNAPAAAAALVHGLIHNHPFHNGNKRTALLAFAIMLESENRFYLEFNEDQVFDLIVSIASHSIVEASPEARASDAFSHDREVLAIYDWLCLHTKEPSFGDRTLRWQDLVVVLRRLGCEFERGNVGNQWKVRLGARQVVTGARNGGQQLEPRDIRRIRRELHLDAEHGVDSMAFYEQQEAHPALTDVVRRFRGVLERLSLLDRT